MITAAPLLTVLAAALASGGHGPPPADEVRIAVVGHIRGDDNGELLGYLEPLLEEVMRTDPHVLVLTGDIVWGDVNNPDGTDIDAVRADWEALDERLSYTDIEHVLRVPGNHDINDLATRDLWYERYGELPRSVDVRGVRLLLMSSAWIPEDGDTRKHPQNAIRGVPLNTEQVSFLEEELERDGYEHAFVFMHHMLWWDDDAPWWREVHPVLARDRADAAHTPRVGAVFAGDYGPLKFSHVRRDGVHYVQSAVENDVSIGMLRMREPSRVLSAQLDNWLLVTVGYPNDVPGGVDIQVRTTGALTTDKFSPQRFREVYEYDKGTIARRLYRKIGWDPERLFTGAMKIGAAGAAGGVVLGGILAALWSWRRRARSAR